MLALRTVTLPSRTPDLFAVRGNGHFTFPATRFIWTVPPACLAWSCLCTIRRPHHERSWPLLPAAKPLMHHHASRRETLDVGATDRNGRPLAEVELYAVHRRFEIFGGRASLARRKHIEPAVGFHRWVPFRGWEGPVVGGTETHGPPASARRLAAVCAPMASVRPCCILRHVGNAETSTREPCAVNSANRERASSRSVRTVTHPFDCATARLRVSVVRSRPRSSANSPIDRGPVRCRADNKVNWVARRPWARSAWSNSRVIARAARRDARHRHWVVSRTAGSGFTTNECIYT